MDYHTTSSIYRWASEPGLFLLNTLLFRSSAVTSGLFRVIYFLSFHLSFVYHKKSISRSKASFKKVWDYTGEYGTGYLI